MCFLSVQAPIIPLSTTEGALSDEEEEEEADENFVSNKELEMMRVDPPAHG